MLTPGQRGRPVKRLTSGRIILKTNELSVVSAGELDCPNDSLERAVLPWKMVISTFWLTNIVHIG